MTFFCSSFAQTQTISHKVQFSGLTWYNKTARTLDTYIVAPAIKYNIPTIAAYSSVIGLLGSHFLWAKTDPSINISPYLAAGAVTTGFFLHKIWQNPKYKLKKKLLRCWDMLRGGEYFNPEQSDIISMEATVNFDDMIGMDNAKEELNIVIEYLNNYKQYDSIGAAPQRFWLLTGPSAAGKTFSIQCLCGQAKPSKIKFLQVNSIITQKTITALSEILDQNTPTIIFFDDIDKLFGICRANPAEKLFIGFLMALQSCIEANPSCPVIVIAATNKPEVIDKSLRYNGNFTREISFNYPSKAEKMLFINRELANMTIDTKDLNIAMIADKTDGISFHHLKDFLNYIVRQAQLLQATSPTQKLFAHIMQELIEKSIDLYMQTGIVPTNP